MALFRKRSTNGSDKPSTGAADDLDAQIARADGARRALDALVKTAQTHISDLPEANKSLAATDRRANDVAQRLESLATRVDDLEKILKRTQAVEGRVLALENRIQQGEERVEKIDDRRSSVEQLVVMGQAAVA